MKIHFAKGCLLAALALQPVFSGSALAQGTPSETDEAERVEDTIIVTGRAIEN